MNDQLLCHYRKVHKACRVQKSQIRDLLRSSINTNALPDPAAKRFCFYGLLSPEDTLEVFISVAKHHRVNTQMSQMKSTPLKTCIHLQK